MLVRGEMMNNGDQTNSNQVGTPNPMPQGGSMNQGGPVNPNGAPMNANGVPVNSNGAPMNPNVGPMSPNGGVMPPNAGMGQPGQMMPPTQSNNKKTGLIIAIIAIVVLIVGAVGGYFYYKQTPTYSFKQVGTAIEKHDWEAFERYVDVDQVADDMYTGVIKGTLRYQFEDSNSKAVDALFREHKDEITADTANVSKNIENLVRGKKTDADKKGKKDSFNFNTNFFENFKYKEIKSIEKSGKHAVVTVVYNLEPFDKDVEVIFEMSKMADGYWMIDSIANVEDVWTTYYDAYQAKLDEVNAPIKAEINKYVSMDELKLFLNRTAMYPYLYYSSKITTMEKPVKDIEIAVTIKGVGEYKRIIEKSVVFHSNVQKTGYNGPWGNSYRLNSSDEDDRLLYFDFKDNTPMDFEIRKITFFDGSSIALKDTL